MKAIDYVKSMTSALDRSAVVNELITLQQEVREQNLPINRAMEEALSGQKIQGKFNAELERRVDKVVRLGNKSHLTVYGTTLERIDGHIDMLIRNAKQSFTASFSAYSMTYTRTAILQLTSVIGQFLRYHRKAMLRIIVDHNTSGGKSVGGKWERGEEEYMSANMGDFVYSLGQLYFETKELEKRLGRASQAEVNESSADLIGAVSPDQADPFQVANLSVSVNPFFMVGKWAADYSHNRYQLAVEESKVIQLRLQELREQQSEAGASPKLQQIIEYNQKRLDKLEYRIRETEEEYAPTY